MDVQEGIRHADKPTIRLTGLCSNHGLELRHVANRSYDHLHSGGQTSGFEGFQEEVSDVWRRHWIEHDGGPSDTWRNLLKQLHPLARQCGLNTGEASDVAAWPRKARDKAAADRIGNSRENDRNGARLLQ